MNEITEFDTEVLGFGGIYIVEFFGNACGPCRDVESMLDRISQISPNNYKFGKFNVERKFEITSRYQILAVPVVMVFQNGRPQRQLTGRHGFDTIKNFIITGLKNT